MLATQCCVIIVEIIYFTPKIYITIQNFVIISSSDFLFRYIYSIQHRKHRLYNIIFLSPCIVVDTGSFVIFQYCSIYIYCKCYADVELTFQIAVLLQKNICGLGEEIAEFISVLKGIRVKVLDRNNILVSELVKYHDFYSIPII